MAIIQKSTSSFLASTLVAGALALAGPVRANNLFSYNHIGGASTVRTATHLVAESECGAGKEAKTTATKGKTADHKCGEGKCGGSKKGKKAAEHSCGADKK